MEFIKFITPCPRGYKAPVRFEELELPRQRITLKERLGGGRFNDVHRALFDNVIEVAVKALKVLYCSIMCTGCEKQQYSSRYLLFCTLSVRFVQTGSATSEQFIAEAKLMYKLSHPKIVQLLGAL